MIFTNKALLLSIASLLSTATVLADGFHGDDAPSAPIYPDQWHAEFSVEKWGNTWLSQSKNGGSFHYDWKRGVKIQEHYEGQKANWCTCANKRNLFEQILGIDSSPSCKIYSYTKDPLEEEKGGAMYAVLPDKGICCKLFQGVGPLKPDWMTLNTQFQGYGKAGQPKRKCQQWFNNKPGNTALMTGDLWKVDDDGVPCGYADKFKWWAASIGFSHYFNFNATTYSTEEEPSEIFDLPAGLDCNQECPNRSSKLSPWCSSTFSGELVGDKSPNQEVWLTDK